MTFSINIRYCNTKCFLLYQEQLPGYEITNEGTMWSGGMCQAEISASVISGVKIHTTDFFHMLYKANKVRMDFT